MRNGSARRRNGWLAATIVALGGAAACTSLLGEPPAGTLAGDGGTGGDGTIDTGIPHTEGGTDSSAGEGSTDSSIQDGPGNDVVTSSDTGPAQDGSEGGGPDPIVSYSTGIAACAVKQSGALWCWGANSGGTVGDGTTLDRAVPVHITKDSTGATLPPMAQVSAGLQHACALTKSGAVYCWGNNDAGQLGDGVALPMEAGAGNQTAPHLVPNVTATQVAAGFFHTCSLSGTQITCWGGNGDGELGHQPGMNLDVFVNGFFYPYANSTPTTGITLLGPAQLSLGGMFSCANDTVAQDPYCWGNNYSGQLGNGPPDSGGTSTWAPQAVRFTGGSSLGLQKEIATSSFAHGCAVTGSGTLSCWGDNGAGQLGNTLPVATGNFSEAFTVMTGVAHVSVSAWTTCIVDGAQHVQCWGANTGGELGHDPATDPFSSCQGSSTPCNANASTIQLSGQPFGPVQTVSVGFQYACAMKTDGTLWCWGRSGALGNGSGDDAGMSFSPVEVSGL
jgi:alpha-tubulin suppressor-like RCC1 family protein